MTVALHKGGTAEVASTVTDEATIFFFFKWNRLPGWFHWFGRSETGSTGSEPVQA